MENNYPLVEFYFHIVDEIKDWESPDSWTVEDFFNDYFDYFDDLLKKRILRDLFIKKSRYRQLGFIAQTNHYNKVYLVSLNDDDNILAGYFVLKQYKLTKYIPIEEIQRLASFANIPFYFINNTIKI